MLVVLSGGGTAGHINPALALAEELEQRGHQVLFAGTPGGVEAQLVPQAGITFKGFEASGFNRSRPTSIVSALKKITASTRAAKQWFAEIKPDVVVGFGGYVSVPVGRAALSLRIPLVVHEQNSVAGMANTYLGKKAQAVALTYECSQKQFAEASSVVVTGNPVRNSVLTATREQGRNRFGIPDDALMLLVFGGSLGARHINTALTKLKQRLLSNPSLYVMHVSGPKEYEAVASNLALTKEEQKRWLLCDYQDYMGEALAAADVVVSRAGATSLAEISARRIPALLVPFPYATEDHQTTNAQAYVDKGAAYMIADGLVEGEEFSKLLFSLVEDDQVRISMKQAAATFDTENAAARLADVVTSAAQA